MKKIICMLLFVPFMFFAFLSPAKSSERGAIELISAEEAAVPDADEASLHIEASLSDDGPSIEIVSPQRGAPLKAPVPITIKFVPRNGKKIDPSTFKLEYLKFITLDLTSKVREYVTKDGIKVPEAKLPSGTHTIRLSIADNTGAVTKQVFTIEVL